MGEPNVAVTRACAAVLRDVPAGPSILMVQYRSWWTLPGGGVEPGETPSAAALRELREETRLVGTVDRRLFSEPTGRGGVCECFLVTVDDQQVAELGYDPERPLHDQHLFDVCWFTLDDKRDDRQVAKVIAALAAPAKSSVR